MTFQVTIIFVAAILNLLGYFDYDRLIAISRMSFLAAILNRNFRLRTADFKFPH